MVIERGDVWWANLGEPRGAEPGFRRPLLVVQAEAFNRSRIETAIVVVLTSNLRLLNAPGNVLVPKRTAGLPKDSVANVSQVLTVDRDILAEKAGKLSGDILSAVDAGLRLVLSL
ncbi:MAG TPA: type II toxin-antitoxin system PemK/MazF family toxin [Gemmatimonadaceae bacterium]|nr:type II toxin-antitoxin system PemK/MazF family toxin [Gemmatimonadaceae bacterium]